MKDAKSVHGEIRRRERDDWRDGWNKDNFALGMAWGGVLVVAVFVFFC